MVLAVPQCIVHHQAFHAFTEGLKEQHGEQLIQWDAMVREWTTDHSKPCPYDLPEEG